MLKVSTRSAICTRAVTGMEGVATAIARGDTPTMTPALEDTLIPWPAGALTEVNMPAVLPPGLAEKLE